MLGVISISEALNRARQQNLDLVEISPNADPPVCRIMDYGKYKYEISRKEREARKKQQSAAMKEIKFHANVGDHDYQTKVRHIREFLADGLKVKASLYFRGRENAHREIGFEVMNRVLKDASDVGAPDMLPKLIGNSIVMVLTPRSGRSGGHGASSAAQAPTAPKPVAATAAPAPVPASPSPPVTA